MYTTTQTSEAKTHGESAIAGAEPSKFVKRIGSTTYVVTVRFSESATKTLDDKILRLIESEVPDKCYVPQANRTAGKRQI